MTAKADRLKQILESDDFQDMLEAVRNEYRTAFERTDISDEEALDIRRMLHLTRRLEHNFHAAIQGGRYEDFRANEESTWLGEITWPRKH